MAAAAEIEVRFEAAISTVFLSKWKVKPGSKVSKGTVLLFYDERKSDELKNANKMKATRVGTVIRLLKAEGDAIHQGCPVLIMRGCSHPIVMKEMCAECGADLRECGRMQEPESRKASVAMVHSIPELFVSQEQAQALGKDDEARLLKLKKLVLLVDLDLTLIHTTQQDIPNNLKDVHHFQLGANSPLWYHTRLRPGTQHFLEKISKLYELHICTFGTRTYAHDIAKVLDKDGRYFSHRILSRDEFFNPMSKTGNLSALFPCGDHMVSIIDDRDDVWNFAPNLIQVKPYRFFKFVGDINAPPGDLNVEEEMEGDGKYFVARIAKRIRERSEKQKAYAEGKSDRAKKDSSIDVKPAKDGTIDTLKKNPSSITDGQSLESSGKAVLSKLQEITLTLGSETPAPAEIDTKLIDTEIVKAELTASQVTETDRTDLSALRDKENLTEDIDIEMSGLPSVGVKVESQNKNDLLEKASSKEDGDITMSDLQSSGFAEMISRDNIDSREKVNSTENIVIDKSELPSSGVAETPSSDLLALRDKNDSQEKAVSTENLDTEILEQPLSGDAEAMVTDLSALEVKNDSQEKSNSTENMDIQKSDFLLSRVAEKTSTDLSSLRDNSTVDTDINMSELPPIGVADAHSTDLSALRDKINSQQEASATENIAIEKTELIETPDENLSSSRDKNDLQVKPNSLDIDVSEPPTCRVAETPSTDLSFQDKSDSQEMHDSTEKNDNEKSALPSNGVARKPSLQDNNGSQENSNSIEGDDFKKSAAVARLNKMSELPTTGDAESTSIDLSASGDKNDSRDKPCLTEDSENETSHLPSSEVSEMSSADQKASKADKSKQGKPTIAGASVENGILCPGNDNNRGFDAASSAPIAKGPELVYDSQVEGLIDVEDDDDYLLYLTEILQTIHRTFYKQVAEKPGEIPDLKKVIPGVRRKVLAGVRIVFSGIIPTNMALDKTRPYQIASSLGAEIQPNLVFRSKDNKNLATTHVIAARPGTLKVNEARRNRKIQVVTPDWLYCCAERWERVNESLFRLVKETAADKKRPLPEAKRSSRQASPSIVHLKPTVAQVQAFPTYDPVTGKRVNKVPAAGKISGNTSKVYSPPPSKTSTSMVPSLPPPSEDKPDFASSFNPLMSFSSEDIASMDQEVEDLLDSPDTDEEETTKEPTLDGSKEKEVDDKNLPSSSSSSSCSLTGEMPHGWGKTCRKRQYITSDVDDASTSVVSKYPRCELPRDSDKSDSERDSDDYAESVGSVDEEMAAAVEREFLSM